MSLLFSASNLIGLVVNIGFFVVAILVLRADHKRHFAWCFLVGSIFSLLNMVLFWGGKFTGFLSDQMNFLLIWQGLSAVGNLLTVFGVFGLAKSYVAMRNQFRALDEECRS